MSRDRAELCRELRQSLFTHQISGRDRLRWAPNTTALPSGDHDGRRSKGYHRRLRGGRITMKLRFPHIGGAWSLDQVPPRLRVRMRTK
jgi:hypothetical protein